MLAVSSVAFGLGLVRAVAGELPKLDPARVQQTERNGVIYDRTGKRVLAVLRGSENRTIVSSEDISPWMKQAIVDVEDRRFWEHNGVDLRAVLRALWADIRHQSVVEGGSTITQQFVKNVWVRDERSIGRKVREAALAWQLTRDAKHWPKERILTAYLNTIYFGNGAYGIQQASQTYFGHGARYLTLPEAALLAGIPADPTRFDPVQNPRYARERRHIVLSTMLDQNDITPAQFAKADTTPLPKPEDVHLPGTQGNEGQYFVNYVKEQLIEAKGASKVFGGGLKVTTTIDLDLQRLARDSIADVLADPDGPDASLVAIDPRNGEVLAMVGGENYRESQFNLAAQAARQPGSAFKPFVLAAALRQGISPATRFDSKPLHIPLGGGKVWNVPNYDDAYLGNADVETGTIMSDNSIYAQLTLLVGPDRVARMARDLGVRSPLNPFYAIGLGVEEVNPLEMARAYATFANGGRRVDGSIFGNRPRVVRELTDEHGKHVVNEPVQERVLGPARSAILTSILRQVVDSGTGRRAQIPGREVAGKTGTTDNYGDAWFVGYTPQLAVAVWVGYPRTLTPMLTEFHGDPVAGGTLPAEIFKRFTQRALDLEHRPAQSFPVAPLLPQADRRVVNRGGSLAVDNGLCHHTREVVYLAGYGPKRLADCRPNEVPVPVVVGRPLPAARELLSARPLTPFVVDVPSKPGQRPGLVVSQEPKRGFLSSNDRVVLFVTKAQHGVVPDLVGSSPEEAQARLRALNLTPTITFGDGPANTVVSQKPRPGVAAAPGLRVALVVARG
jgi:penicillin-binding protein 1A